MFSAPHRQHRTGLRFGGSEMKRPDPSILDNLQLIHDALVEESCHIRTQEQYRRAMQARRAAFQALLAEAARQFKGDISPCEAQP
jgi:hypothetical protein